MSIILQLKKVTSLIMGQNDISAPWYDRQTEDITYEILLPEMYNLRLIVKYHEINSIEGYSIKMSETLKKCLEGEKSEGKITD